MELIIIGGGIVGMATAYQYLRKYPDREILVLEKEAQLAQHQTGHNSGVLHTGIYYRPGSLKAANCVAGRKAMVAFCQQHGIAHETCGKVIVATNGAELPRLENLLERGQANGVSCEMIQPERLAELEPHVTGIRAIHVHDAGIVDYPAVVSALKRIVTEGGGKVVTNARVTGIASTDAGVVVRSSAGEFTAPQIINCAGLHSDHMVKLSGGRPPARIVPFRGEYYKFRPGAKPLCRNLIYPVPDPAFPFLGVHFTRMIGGGIDAGPNAVLAFAREGYRKTDIHLGDLLGTLTYPGFLRLALRYWRVGAGEMWRSLNKRAFVRALQRLVPELQGEDLEPAPAGVRAQAVTRNGGLADDFLIQQQPGILHVCNAPSPAATACLQIGAAIVDRLAT